MINEKYFKLAEELLNKISSEIIDNNMKVFFTNGILKYLHFLTINNIDESFEILLFDVNEFYENNLLNSHEFFDLSLDEKSLIIYQYLSEELPEWITINLENVYSERECNLENKKEPYDIAAIDIVNDKYDIYSLYRKYNKEDKELELSPDYQRNFVWNSKQKSRLIESILIKIPLPIFYIDARDEGKWVVIDGLQRLTSIFKFMDNDFKLSNLEFLTYLNGRKFSQLERKHQRSIEDTQLLCNKIRPGTPANIAFSIFKRINTLGSKLEIQEIRNAMYRGKSTTLLIELSKSREFIDIITTSKVKGLSKHMDDHAIILRYLAFKLNNFSVYEKNNMNTFLEQAMDQLNAMRDIKIESLKNIFKECMIKANILFSEFSYAAFTKPPKDKARPNPISKTLFESIGYSLDKYKLSDIEKNKINLAIELNKLYQNKDFIFKTSVATNNPPNVKYRFEIIEELFKKVIGY